MITDSLTARDEAKAQVAYGEDGAPLFNLAHVTTAGWAPLGSGLRYRDDLVAANDAGDRLVVARQTAVYGDSPRTPERWAPAVWNRNGGDPAVLEMPTFDFRLPQLNGVAIRSLAMSGNGDRVVAAVTISWDFPDTGLWDDYVVSWTHSSSGWSSPTIVRGDAASPLDQYVSLHLSSNGTRLSFVHGVLFGPRDVQVFTATATEPTTVISNYDGDEIAMSSDGRWLAYIKQTGSLFEVRGRVVDNSSDPDRVIVPGTANAPKNLVLSRKGRYLAFISTDPQEPSAPTNGDEHVYSWDRDWDSGGTPNKTFDEAGVGNRVQWAQALDHAGLSATGLASPLVMSGDGTVLARAGFDGDSCEQTSGGSAPQLVVWSQENGTTARQRDQRTVPTGLNQCELSLVISDDGLHVGWVSQAPYLSDDANGLFDVYEYEATAAYYDAHRVDRYNGWNPNTADGGDPVSLTSGNFHHSETDSSFGDGIYGLSLERTYNSRDTTTSDFGAGWSHIYGQRLVAAGTGNAARDLVLADGRRVRFAPANGGAWTSPRGFDGILDTTGTDPKITLPGGEVWTLWPVDTSPRSGFIKTMGDGKGQLVTIDRSVAGVLTSAVSNRGSSATNHYGLSFTANASGRVDSVTTTGTPPSETRTVAYTYQSAGSGASWAPTLQSASKPYIGSDPHGVTHYAVDPDTGTITDITIDGVGYSAAVATTTVVHNDYLTDGRVRRQVLDNGDEVRYRWSDVDGSVEVTNLASGDTNRYVANGTGETTTRVDSTTQHSSQTGTFNDAAGGKQATSTDRGGANYGYTYDTYRRVIQRATPDPATGALPSRVAGLYPPPGQNDGWGLETWTYAGTSPTDRRIDTYTNAAGEVTKYTYTNADLLPTTVTKGFGTPAAQTTTYGLTNGNRIDSILDGDGVKTCTDYDPDSGLVIAVRANCQLTDPAQQAKTSYEYNSMGELKSRTDPAGQAHGAKWQYTYYGDGSQKSISDPGGTATTYEYLPTGEQSKITSPGPGTDSTSVAITTFSVARNQPPALCGTAGTGCRIDTTTVPYNAGATFTAKKIYDRSGDLREEWAPGATAPTRYHYGPQGRLDTVTDPTNVVTSYRYDANGHMTASVAGDDPTATDYTAATDYDAQGRVTKTTTGANAATGNRVTTQLALDKVGRVRTETTAAGTSDQIIKSTDYNAAGEISQTVIKRTDYPASVSGSPVDAFTKYNYTPGGRVACVQRRIAAAQLGVAELSSFTKTDYSNGHPTAVHTSVSGVRSVAPTPPATTPWGCDQYTYATDPGTWTTTASSYTPEGLLAWSQNPQQYNERPTPTAPDHVNYRTSYTYDDFGRPTRVDTPDPAHPGTAVVADRTCYTRRGEIAATITSANAVTLYAYYDQPGLTKTVTDPTGTTYNSSTPCASTAGPNSRTGVTTSTYDGRGNQLTRQVWLDNNSTDPNSWVSTTETWGYDAAGRYTSYTNGTDAPITVAYPTDSHGRITDKITTTGSGGDTRTHTEHYFPSGATATVTDTTGATTRTVASTYDAAGRTKTQTVAGSPASTLTYTYNQAGNVVQVDYPAVGTQTAKTAKTWWNLVGVPTHLTLTNGSWWRLGHDQAGRLTGVDLAYGAWVPVGAYTLDGNGQPLVETLNSGSGGMTRTTSRDPATGQPSQINQVVDTKTCTWALTHDNAGRLKTVAQTSATNQTCDQPGQTTTYGYDAASQLLSAANTGTVPDGRPKSWTYTYGNTGNRLTETAIRKGTGGGADTTTTTASRYNGGRLCATGPTLPTSCNAATGVTTYGYDTAGRRTSVTRPTGQPSTTYTYDPGGRLASTSFAPISGGTDVVTRGYDPAGSMNLDAHTKPNNTTEELVSYWDHTGATPVPQVMTTAISGGTYQLSYGYERITSTGNWYAYDPLGSDLPTSTNPLSPSEYDPYGTPANWPVDFGWNYFGYRGEWANGDHLNLRKRDYDYRTGTFLTRDPLGGVTGTTTVANPYHYTNNNPVNSIDPTGLRPKDPKPFCIQDDGGFQRSGFLVDLTTGACVNVVGLAKPEIMAECAKGIGRFSKDALIGLLKNAGTPMTNAVQNMVEAFIHDPGNSIPIYSQLKQYDEATTNEERCQALFGLAVIMFGAADAAAAFDGIVTELGEAPVVPEPPAVEPGPKPGPAPEPEPAPDATPGPACASFTPDTAVLMANGTTRPIKDVKIGDEVLATDPATGMTSSRRVTATMSHDDDDLLDLTIVDAEGQHGVLQTTDHHRIWSVTAGAWVLASDLSDGDQLREPDGSTATLVESAVRPGHQQMLDLTIDVDHTFYVDYGGDAILVHNCGELPGPGDVPTKVVNSNMPHAAEQAVERAGFTDVQSARAALQDLGREIETSGFPEGTIPDTNPGRVLVPFGKNGYAVYQIAPNGNAVLKTVLIAR